MALYMCDDIRNELTITINEINPSFQDLSVQDKFIELMSNPIYYRVVSKAICYILNKRRFNKCLLIDSRSIIIQ